MTHVIDIDNHPHAANSGQRDEIDRGRDDPGALVIPQSAERSELLPMCNTFI
jgi:hypothetical protein